MKKLLALLLVVGLIGLAVGCGAPATTGAPKPKVDTSKPPITPKDTGTKPPIETKPDTSKLPPIETKKEEKPPAETKKEEKPKETKKEEKPKDGK